MSLEKIPRSVRAVSARLQIREILFQRARIGGIDIDEPRDFLRVQGCKHSDQQAAPRVTDQHVRRIHADADEKRVQLTSHVGRRGRVAIGLRPSDTSTIVGNDCSELRNVL